MNHPEMPDQPTNLKVLAGVVQMTLHSAGVGILVGGSDLVDLLASLTGQRIKMTIELVGEDG